MAGRKLFLVEKSDNCLAFVDLDDGTVDARVALPRYPHELLVDAARGYVLVGHYGVRSSVEEGTGGSTVFVVDLEQRAIVNALDCSPHSRIHGLAQDEAGRVYALSESSALLLTFESARGSPKPMRMVPTGGVKSHLVSITRNGLVGFSVNLASNSVTRFAPYDAAIAPVPLVPGERPEGNRLSADETTLFVTNRGSDTIAAIDTEAFAVTRLKETRRDPLRVYLAGPDRLLVIFFEGRGLALLDQRSLKELAYLDLTGRPAAACVAPDATTAFVSLDTNQSLEVDLRTLSIIAARPTGREPDACFMLPG